MSFPEMPNQEPQAAASPRPAASPTWTWTPSSPPWSCCATRSCRASRWSSAAGGRAAAAEPRAFQRLRSYAGRGVVTTATYEARAFGVHSGLGLMKAAALAPEAILLPGGLRGLHRVSRLFKAAVAELAPVHRGPRHRRDLHRSDRGAGETRELAQRLKDAVREATGLSCSIGVTPNKLLSKIASELQKPDGLTMLALEDVPTRIWPLPCAAINGIGPKASAKLEALRHPHHRRAGRRPIPPSWSSTSARATAPGWRGRPGQRRPPAGDPRGSASP